ncbi:class I SAM-dependent methyltransferase [Phytoactinopolyspora mesophila]|uniref:Methyltransferase domain-containing protein n=1 Tax=Phytoactinopolyspora mesophila TaxID=2650750 RepID=A0A7K3M0P7_9ACTN|nr:methyltransferase domain-containing protein [Phytoactinopolyspora mesophila]NDL56849.1 methyltransferase domain-containing protein [Phytoactinopolyspora mesophila]
MGGATERLTLLARAWDEAAEEYERYFVPRFAPWVDQAVGAVTGQPLPPGQILVPCCGTFPELPALQAGFPDREIFGVDLSAGMVQIARARAAGSWNVWVVEGNAATLGPEWTDACAGVVSVFGLQQLPDPAAALADWAQALRPGGCLSVVFWPTEVESDGPFALLSQVLAAHRPLADDAWQAQLGNVLAGAGVTIERDEYLSFPMSHEHAEAFWTAMTSGGPLRSVALAEGDEFMGAMRETFLAAAPAGQWNHMPRARWIVARR